MWWKHIENDENLINAPQKWEKNWKIVKTCKKVMFFINYF
jgi:hypothetical protein